MKQLWSICLCLFLVNLSIAQEQFSQTIRGTVIDKESQIPLIGANVILVGSEPLIGVNTDIDGIFKIENVSVGRQSLQITYLGYENTVIPNIEVISGKETVLMIALTEDAFQSEEVVVTASKQDKDRAINEMAVVSARQFSVEETRRYAGARDDVSRMAANFAGVSGANDSRNDIIIRGNSPLGLLWRLEGIDIPNPNHFGGFGTTGGPVSILNNNLLSNSDFFTGAFPSEYGNALSGVFDLRLRNGNNEQYEFMGQVGFNGFEFGAEGPINKEKGSSFLANYRYSTLGAFDALGINFGFVGIPFYQDGTFKINLPNKKWGNISIFGIGGKSNIEMLDSERGEGEANINGSGRDLRNGTRMGTIGLNHKYLINNQSYTNFSIAASTQRENTEIDQLDDNGENPERSYQSDFNRNTITARFLYNNKTSARHTFRAGITGNYYYANFIDSARLDEGRFVRIRDFDGNSNLLQLFAQSKYKLAEEWTMVGGLYAQYFFLNESRSIEPRLAFQYTPSALDKVSFAYGRHAQLQPFLIYFDQTETDINVYERTNENLDFTYSNQFVLGYDRILGDDFRLKAEAYYQHLTNVPVQQSSNSFSLLNFGADFGGVSADSLVNEGFGRNYGVELTVEKFFSKNYYGLLTASIFDSEYQGSDGVWRNTAFNTGYVVNVLFGMEFNIGKNNTLSFDLKATVAGGRRYTPIDLTASQLEGEEVLIDNEAFSLQFQTYFKPDFKISFRNNNKNYSQIWSIQLENFINRKNVFLQYYDEGENEIITEYQLGLFPLMQYRIEF